MSKGYRSNHGPTEQQIQLAVCRHLLWRGVPGLVWFHPPMGGYRTPTEAKIMKGLGVKAGVADLILLHNGEAFALELKTEKGRASDAQLKFATAWQLAGGSSYIANGLDEALAVLKTWGLLKGENDAWHAPAGELATV